MCGGHEMLQVDNNNNKQVYKVRAVYYKLMLLNFILYTDVTFIV
jgi:hypothetical protein